MKNPVWATAIKESAEPHRARQILDSLAATTTADSLATVAPEQARIFCALFSGSQALSDWLIAHPERACLLTPELLKHPRRAQGVRREVEGWFSGLLKHKEYSEALARLRRFKQAEMLRIGARDLAHLANQTEVTRELSDVAEVCLSGVWGVCGAQLSERLGRPFHQDAADRWQPTASGVIGLGKLGVVGVFMGRGCSSHGRGRLKQSMSTVAWDSCGRRTRRGIHGTRAAFLLSAVAGRRRAAGGRLIAGYRQLRRVEGIMRRWSFEGETVLPEEAAAFYRVAVRCGFGTAADFRLVLADWRRAVRAAYERVISR